MHLESTVSRRFEIIENLAMVKAFAKELKDLLCLSSHTYTHTHILIYKRYEIEGTRDGSTPIDEIALSREINEISDF